MLAHLQELKKRLLFIVVALLIFFLGIFFLLSDFLIQEIMSYFKELFKTVAPEKPFYFIFTTLPEAFLLKVKISFYTALILLVPFIEYHVWQFLSPGLYAHERKNGLCLIFSFPLLFLLGALCLFGLVLPNALSFFSFLTTATGADQALLLPHVSDYIFLIVTFLMIFGLSFQLPLLLIFLVKSSVLSLSDLRKFRRYAIVFIFILAAVLTPPDVLSQVSLAIPLIALYEGTILYLRLTQKESHD